MDGIAARETAVRREIVRLDKAVSAVNEASARLMERLQVVLRDEPNKFPSNTLGTSSGSAEAPPPIHAPLSSEIAGFRDRIDAVFDRLQAIENRLEL